MPENSDCSYSSPQRGEVGRGELREAGRGEFWQPTPISPALLVAARNLRLHMTDAEHLLWKCLRGNQLGGFKFRKQHPCERYVLDFYCPLAKLALELDGGQHNTDAGRTKDAARMAFLEQQGIRVMRFWNHDVLNQTEGVLNSIWRALHEFPPPQPSPAGGGSRMLSAGKGEQDV